MAPSLEELNAEEKKKRAAAAAAKARTAPPAASAAPEPVAQPAPRAAPAGFTCDGRTHCSQMHSCAEAKYFLAHCPGVKMDGNGDGIPCEKQWCNP